MVITDVRIPRNSAVLEELAYPLTERIALITTEKLTVKPLKQYF